MPHNPSLFLPVPLLLEAPVRRACKAPHRPPAAWAPPASSVAADNVEAPVPGLQRRGGARTGKAGVWVGERGVTLWGPNGTACGGAGTFLF